LLRGKIRLGAGTRLISHVAIFGDTEIGEANVLHPNVVIGDEPQGTTIHRGSEHGEVTIVGVDNFFMQNSHAAHDCRIGNSTIIAGGALLAGWVEVGDRALVSGNCVVHQYTRIGRLAMMRGLSRTSRDIPPFCIMDGTHTLRGINVVGLRRAGFKVAQVRALREVFLALFGKRQNLKMALERIVSEKLTPEVREMVDFIRASKRGVAFGPRDGAIEDSEE
jgi:UDP-N-acetylglucosamine acyltransferase